jgi:hypothetical protein
MTIKILLDDNNLSLYDLFRTLEHYSVGVLVSILVGIDNFKQLSGKIVHKNEH